MANYGDWELYVHDVKGKMERGEVKPDPDWQRGYIWKPKDERLLIDSILKGIPIPKFYLTQEYDAKKGTSIHYAVDGQQRLTAIYRFLINEFPVGIDGKDYRFKDLDQQTQKKITTYKLNGHYIRDYTQAEVTLLFKRLNSTGYKPTNMELWHTEYDGTGILAMVEQIYSEHKTFYEDVIYTEENIKRMLPSDDITDLCNCLKNNSVESGSKKEIDSFLKNNKDISKRDSDEIKSKFKKVLNNIEAIFSKQELEACNYSKRTHFISLFLSIAQLVPNYYILNDIPKVKEKLLDFIENQPEEYRESVLGAIRQKAAREMRVKLLKRAIEPFVVKLDENRFFGEDMRQKFWRRYDGMCQLCNKSIVNYSDATLDHKRPWAKGGVTIEGNAQLAQKTCNQKKRDACDKFAII